MKTMNPGDRLSMKTGFHTVKMGRSHDCLVFAMGIPVRGGGGRTTVLSLRFAMGIPVRGGGGGGGLERYLLEWVPKDQPHVDDSACLRQSNGDFAAMRFFPPDLTHWPLKWLKSWSIHIASVPTWLNIKPLGKKSISVCLLKGQWVK